MSLPPFLRLAAETRNQIYGYLLSTRYTKHYPREIDPEWEHVPSRLGLARRPKHTYCFHVGILRVTRQINLEASSVLYDQNMFVEVTSDFTKRDIDFEWLGVPVVTKGATASRFVFSVLQIQIRQENTVGLPNKGPLHIIFAGVDLPAFCTALFLGGTPPERNFGGSLLINLNCSTTVGIALTRASFSVSQVTSLLAPLRVLHSFRFAHITGPLDEKYKMDLCRSICKAAPSFEESLFEVLVKVQEGDVAFNAGIETGHYLQALRIYNAAMTDLKDRCGGLAWTVSQRLGPATPSAADIQSCTAYFNLRFKLRVKLAAVLFELGHHEKTRQWMVVAVKPIRFSPLTSDDKEAYLLHARINKKLGRWTQAIDSMEDVVAMAPHLRHELELLKGDAKRHREQELKARKKDLAKFEEIVKGWGSGE